MSQRHLAALLALALVPGAAAARATATAVPLAPPVMAQATPAPPPTTAEKQQPTTVAEPLVRVYGTFNPRIIVSSAAEESFSQATAVAITAAGNPAYAVRPDSARFTIQVQQTRFGLWVNEKGPFRGQLEFDFVDFSKATPTVQAIPRLRIARADYVMGPHTLQLGQDWDLNAPLNPHGINLVGALFQAGNAGFMRQQLRYLYSTDALEVGAALGFPGINAGPKEGPFELNLTPSIAGRAAYKFGKSRAGASFIFSRLPYAVGTPGERFSPSYQGVLFTELAPTAETNVRVELNYGQNTANLGLLTLAQGNATQDYQEAGGFVSVRQALAAEHAVYGMVGHVRVLDADQVVPSYSYPAPEATPGTAVLAGTGPGIRNNTAVRLGYEFRPLPALGLVLEGFLYQTEHALLEVDRTRSPAFEGARRALGVETGILLTF